MAPKFLTGIDLTNQKGINFADPTALTDAVNLQTLQNYIAGLAWKDDVRVATTASGTLASSFENGDTVDGVVLATGNRILIKNQSTQTENGIYIVAVSGAPARSFDADSTTDLNNATVSVTEGTVNGNKSYTQTTANPTVGSSNIVWASFNVGITYTADGDGIELTGSVFSIELDGTTLAKSAAGLRIGSGAAGAGLIESSGVLAVGAGTGITVNANDVAIDATVVAKKFSTSFGNGVLTSFSLTHGLGTQDLDVIIKEVSTGTRVFADVTLPPAGTTVDLTFAVAPTTNQYRLTAVG